VVESALRGSIDSGLPRFESAHQNVLEVSAGAISMLVRQRRSPPRQTHRRSTFRARIGKRRNENRRNHSARKSCYQNVLGSHIATGLPGAQAKPQGAEKPRTKRLRREMQRPTASGSATVRPGKTAHVRCSLAPARAARYGAFSALQKAPSTRACEPLLGLLRRQRIGIDLHCDARYIGMPAEGNDARKKIFSKERNFLGETRRRGYSASSKRSIDSK